MLVKELGVLTVCVVFIEHVEEETVSFFVDVLQLVPHDFQSSHFFVDSLSMFSVRLHQELLYFLLLISDLLEKHLLLASLLVHLICVHHNLDFTQVQLLYIAKLEFLVFAVYVVEVDHWTVWHWHFNSVNNNHFHLFRLNFCEADVFTNARKISTLKGLPRTSQAIRVIRTGERKILRYFGKLV
jgi:hypothetical protein